MFSTKTNEITNTRALRNQRGTGTASYRASSGPATSECDDLARKNQRKAARLLVEIRKCLAARGIRSVHDPRVSAPLRRVWLRLLASNAVEGLLLEEVGRQWQCVKAASGVTGSATRLHVDQGQWEPGGTCGNA